MTMKKESLASTRNQISTDEDYHFNRYLCGNERTPFFG